MKFEIIDKLEKRFAPNLQGQFYLCKDGKFHTPLGAFNLTNYETGQLEVMLQKSISQEEVNMATTERLMLLHEEQIMNADTQEADEWFKRLTPKAQKQVIKRAYHQWYNDQQVALAMAEGSY